MSTEELIHYAVSNIGAIFSMFLGALASLMMCWGFGRG